MKRLALLTATVSVVAALSLASAQTAAQTTTLDRPAPPPTDPAFLINVVYPNTTGVKPGLTADAYYSEAQALAAQAQVAYPTSFYDQPLWHAATNYAEAAHFAAPDNLEYEAYLGQLYTTTNYWYAAYLVWADLEKKQALTDQQRGWAALSAAKLGFISLSRGLASDAVPFLQDSLRWQDNAMVRAMLDRAQSNL